MDIGQFAFPFIMAVITNSLMIIVIYFLCKIPYFANLFSVWFMVVLYLVCVLRVFLPLEFPSVQVIIRDSFIYNLLVDSVSARTEAAIISPNIAFYVIVGVWALGTIVFAIVSVVTHRSKRTYYLANFDFTTEKENAIFDKVADLVLGKSRKNLTLKKTDAVDFIMVIGYFRRYVLLPVKDYNDEELEMIFRHECTHIKNKDLWIKLLIHVYCCIFWWNPFSYLLKHDLDFTLEMKCDLSATKGFDAERTKLYLETVRKNSKTKQAEDKTREKSQFFICAELSNARKSKELVKRVKAITLDRPKKVGQVTANVLVSLVLVAIFVVSYFFILQPFYGYDAEDELYELNEGATIVDSSLGYLVLQDNGNYLFYVADFPPEEIPKEDVEQGLFEGYPILEN